MIGVTVYSVAFGGLFALTFASPMAAWVLTVRGRRSFCWLFRYVVPNLKYPANPPSVGDPDTIGIRTARYFSMIVISLAAMIAAWTLRNRLTGVVGDWNAVLIAGAPYFVVVTIAALALPVVNEVPEGFPAVVLWQFRVASLGAQDRPWLRRCRRARPGTGWPGAIQAA
jgi:hypothetical protein